MSPEGVFYYKTAEGESAGHRALLTTVYCGSQEWEKTALLQEPAAGGTPALGTGEAVPAHSKGQMLEAVSQLRFF